MKIRTIIFWGHLISGLVIGSVILVMGVTGALMSFEPQIVELTERRVSKVNAPGTEVERLSLTEMIENAGKANPKTPATAIIAYSDPGAAFLVNFKEKAVFVNPYTGETLGGRSQAHEFLHQVENIHRRLAAGESGRTVTHACNAAFFVMILSGLYLWWPRKWSKPVLNSVLFFNPHLSQKAKNWNWHNVIGFWCSPLLLITTLTGLVISYSWANNLLFRLTGNEPPSAMQRMVPKADEITGETAPEIKMLSTNWDGLFMQAQENAPSWKSMSIRLGREPGMHSTAYIKEAGNPSFASSQLKMDPTTAEIKQWEPFAEQNSGRKLKAWIVPIHTGQAGGIWGGILAFIAASGAIMLIYTGFSMAWRRFFLKQKLVGINR